MFLYQESQFLELAVLIKAYLGHCLDLFFTKCYISLGVEAEQPNTPRFLWQPELTNKYPRVDLASR